MLLVQSKLYLEGINVPITSAFVTSGAQSSAYFDIANIKGSIINIKPGTIAHYFIFYEGAWRLFFFGKYAGITCNSSQAQLRFNSVFSEIEKAVYTPVSMQTSSYGQTVPLLYVSKEVTKSDKGSQFLIATNSGELGFFSWTDLLANGSIPSYYEKVIEAATLISPWYKVQADSFNLRDFYFILDNPNILPVTNYASVQSLVDASTGSFGRLISFEDILQFLSKQLRYKKIILNTPIKIDGVWRWIIYLPEYSFMPPFKKENILDSDIIQLDMMEDFENEPTRVQFSFLSGQQAIDLLSQTEVGFIYSYPDTPIKQMKNVNYSEFTEEEKYRGVNAKVQPLDNLETFYSFIDWTKKSSVLNTEKVDYNTLPKANYTRLYTDMAKFEYLSDRSMRFEQSNFIPVADFTFRPLFPISVSSYPDLSFVVDSVSYTIDNSGISLSAIPSSAIDLTQPLPKLRWDPDDYADPNKFYARFDYNTLITEDEYWKIIGVDINNVKYYSSAKLDADYIMQTVKDKNIKKYYTKSPFCYERALNVANFIKEAYNEDIKLHMTNQVEMK